MNGTTINVIFNCSARYRSRKKARVADDRWQHCAAARSELPPFINQCCLRAPGREDGQEIFLPVSHHRI